MEALRQPQRAWLGGLGVVAALAAFSTTAGVGCGGAKLAGPGSDASTPGSSGSSSGTSVTPGTGSGGGSGSSSGGSSGSSSGGTSTCTGLTSAGSGGSSGSSSGSNYGGPGCDDAGACDLPPAPSGSATAATTPQNFAIHHLHLGDELDSASDPDWYRYGYDIDGLTTTAASTNGCTLYANANTKNQTDGPGGIDNSFGENIVPLLQALVANPSASADAPVAAGSYTLMMDLTGLVPSAGQTATGLGGMLLTGAPFGQGPNAPGATPTWTIADVWPLDPASVTSAFTCNILLPPVTSSATFSGAYVANGVFVSGRPIDVKLSIPLAGARLVLPIRHAMITFNYPGAMEDAGTASTHASGGIIAGVIKATDLVDGFAALGAAEGFCSALAQVDTAIFQSADIMSDGTNAAGESCDAISIGVGFDADQIALPQLVGVPATPPSACDAGADGG